MIDTIIIIIAIMIEIKWLFIVSMLKKVMFFEIFDRKKDSSFFSSEGFIGIKNGIIVCIGIQLISGIFSNFIT
jgi:hypothetical protein